MFQPFDFILQKAPIFFLAAARVFGMILTTPLLSTRAVPRTAKVALAGLIAFLVMPAAYPKAVSADAFSLYYVFLVLGEGLIGVLTGFYIMLIFSAFSTAGQFFTYQMGFGASGVYDSLAQVENPLMGQYFNFIAAVVFLQINGFQKLFFSGVFESFETINCFVFLEKQEPIVQMLLKSVGVLFLKAMVMALPIIGTLILIHVTMGLLTKAAPQMNLLSEGFPITILVTFFLLTVMLPYLINSFTALLENGFADFRKLLIELGGGI